MLHRLVDFDSPFHALDELRRQMERSFDDAPFAPRFTDAPRAASHIRGFGLYDDGEHLVVTADVPGLTEKDVELTLEDSALTLKAQWTPALAEGATVRHRERRPFALAHTVTLPVKVDGERAVAEVKDGVLVVRLAKAQEAKPRTIAVRASS